MAGKHIIRLTYSLGIAKSSGRKDGHHTYNLAVSGLLPYFAGGPSKAKLLAKATTYLTSQYKYGLAYVAAFQAYERARAEWEKAEAAKPRRDPSPASTPPAPTPPPPVAPSPSQGPRFTSSGATIKPYDWAERQRLLREQAKAARRKPKPPPSGPQPPPKPKAFKWRVVLIPEITVIEAKRRREERAKQREEREQRKRELRELRRTKAIRRQKIAARSIARLIYRSSAMPQEALDSLMGQPFVKEMLAQLVEARRPGLSSRISKAAVEAHPLKVGAPSATWQRVGEWLSSEEPLVPQPPKQPRPNFRHILINTAEHIEGEVWARSTLYPRYQVSTMGRIRQLNRPETTRAPRKRVWLRAKSGETTSINIGKLVLHTFVGLPDKNLGIRKLVAKRMNGDQDDVRLANLTWAPRRRPLDYEWCPRCGSGKIHWNRDRLALKEPRK